MHHGVCILKHCSADKHTIKAHLKIMCRYKDLSFFSEHRHTAVKMTGTREKLSQPTHGYFSEKIIQTCLKYVRITQVQINYIGTGYMSRQRVYLCDCSTGSQPWTSQQKHFLVLPQIKIIKPIMAWTTSTTTLPPLLGPVVL